MDNGKKVENKHHDLRSLSNSKVLEICIGDESLFFNLTISFLNWEGNFVFGRLRFDQL